MKKSNAKSAGQTEQHFDHNKMRLLKMRAVADLIAEVANT